METIAREATLYALFVHAAEFKGCAALGLLQ